MVSIIPSLASANPLDLKAQMDCMNNRALHLDIEDGNFVPNITFGLRTIKAIAGVGSHSLDAHLMVTDPSLYLDELMEVGIKKIAIHIEAVSYPAEWLYQIHSGKALAGLAINCKTPVEQFLPYMELIDYVLIMTSEPDGQGQLFNPYMLGKISKARQLLPSHISIMADGGISAQCLADVVHAGADTIVMGRAIWDTECPAGQLDYLLQTANGG